MYCEEHLKDVQEGETADDIAGALDLLEVRSRDPKSVRAKRCFSVKVKDEVKGELVKWIVAPSRDSELAEAVELLRTHQALAPIGVSLEEDTCPMAQAAKEVKSLVFTGKSTGPKKPKKK